MRALCLLLALSASAGDPSANPSRLIEEASARAQAALAAFKSRPEPPPSPARQDLEQAERDILAVADSRQRELPIQLAAADALLRARRFPAAERLARRALELEPGNAAAMVIRAQSTGRSVLITNSNDSDNSKAPINTEGQPAKPSFIYRAPTPRQPTFVPGRLQPINHEDPFIPDAIQHYSSYCGRDDRYACDAAQITANCFDSSPKNICTRRCLVDIDRDCARMNLLERQQCRIRAHASCYYRCGKFTPQLVEIACYTKMWGSLFKAKP